MEDYGFSFLVKRPLGLMEYKIGKGMGQGQKSKSGRISLEKESARPAFGVAFMMILE
jgi:hypothetical protein